MYLPVTPQRTLSFWLFEDLVASAGLETVLVHVADHVLEAQAT